MQPDTENSDNPKKLRPPKNTISGYQKKGSPHPICSVHPIRALKKFRTPKRFRRPITICVFAPLWCSVYGVNHDLGSLINKRLGIINFKGRLSQMPPVGYQDMSKMNEMELKELEAGFRCYTINPKVYWKRAPRWIRALKGL